MQVVNAATIGEQITNSLSLGNLGSFNFFKNLDSTNIGLSKFLFFLLIALMVFGVVDLLPIMPDSTITKTWIALGISVVVALLAIMNFDVQVINSILVTYDALGITLSVILPFMIIAGLSFKFYQQGYALFSKFIWLVFLVILSVRLLSMDSSKFIQGWGIAYLIILILSAILFIWDRRVYRLFSRKEFANKLDVFQNQLEKQAAKRKLEAKDFEESNRRPR
jgi:hypothetical protein